VYEQLVIESIEQNHLKYDLEVARIAHSIASQEKPMMYPRGKGVYVSADKKYLTY
jgi:hypothetical protein